MSIGYLCLVIDTDAEKRVAKSTLNNKERKSKFVFYNAMNFISLCTRKTASLFFKRYFYKGSIWAQKDKMQVGNPFCLQPIGEEDDNHTLRRHDNCRRQRVYEFGLYVAACLPKYVQKVQMQHNDELEILVAPDGFYQVQSFLAHHHNACFDVCSSATAIDVPSREFRFELVYNLLSLRFSERVRVKTYTDELTSVRSAYSLWKVCNYFEREIYDMFGIIFTEHPDLRRILTDYGFKGHPLRKDYPLVGYTEVRYDDELKKLVYEPVEFAQEYRSFKLQSPWSYSKNFHEGYNNPKPPPKKQ